MVIHIFVFILEDTLPEYFREKKNYSSIINYEKSIVYQIEISISRFNLTTNMF